MEQKPDNKLPDIPKQIFEQFIVRLEEQKTPKEIVERLRTALMSDKRFTDKAFKDALFGEEPKP